MSNNKYLLVTDDYQPHLVKIYSWKDRIISYGNDISFTSLGITMNLIFNPSSLVSKVKMLKSNIKM